MPLDKMKENPTVSVIINCYNGEEFLRETIDSVINQTYSNWELIFWDNQSTDSSAEIIKSYQDDRIRYFYAPTHTPLGEARNYAIDNAKGDYLTFLDSDDVWMSDFLKYGTDCLDNNPQLVGYYSNRYVIKNGTSTIGNDEISGIRTIDNIIENYKIDVSACLLRLNIIKLNDIHVNSTYQMIEDYDFFIKVAVHGNFFYDNKPLMSFRVHFSETYRKREKWYYEYCSFRSFAELLYKDGIVNNKSLEAVDRKIVESKLGALIVENRRMDYLSHFLCHINVLYKYWKQFLLYMLFGRDRFIRIMNRRLSKI